MNLEAIWKAVKPFAMQHKEEFTQLLQLMLDYDIKNVLEIGTYKGGSALGFLSIGCNVISIDIEKQKEIEILEKAHPFAYTFLKGSCKDYAWNVPLFNMVYIDGDHSYEGAKADFQSYLHTIKTGGMMVFHDIIPFDGQNHYGSAKLWNELRDIFPDTTEEIIKPGTTKESHDFGGFGILLV